MLPEVRGREEWIQCAVSVGEHGCSGGKAPEATVLETRQSKWHILCYVNFATKGDRKPDLNPQALHHVHVKLSQAPPKPPFPAEPLRDWPMTKLLHPFLALQTLTLGCSAQGYAGRRSWGFGGGRRKRPPLGTARQGYLKTPHRWRRSPPPRWPGTLCEDYS